MKFLLIVSAILGLACAGDEYVKPDKSYSKNEVINHVEYSGGYEEHSYHKTLVYHGKYPGKCGNDGFYYNDLNSFIICSNGNAYTQNCAPGSVNSGYAHYEYGKTYYYHDFCDVNLVDRGYAVHHGGYGAPYDGYYNGYGYDHGYGYGHGYDGYDGYRGHGYHAEGYYRGHYGHERPLYYGYKK